MAFFIRSKQNAPLTFVREQQQFERTIATGVYSGMQVSKRAAGNWSLNLSGGTFSINGIVIFEDASQEGIFHLSSPSGNEHHCLYVSYDPDVDAQPSYGLVSGTWTSPASIPGSISAHGMVLADVWIPSTATSLNDAIIVNRQALIVGPTPSTHVNCSMKAAKLLKSGTTYTLHIDDMVLATVAQDKAVDETPMMLPISIKSVITGVSSSEYGSGYSAACNTTDDYILYGVVAPDGWTNNDPLQMFALSYSAGGSEASVADLGKLVGTTDPSFANENHFPFRSDFRNLFIIAIANLKHGWITMAGGIAMPIDTEFVEGRFEGYVTGVLSTEYGTGPVAPTAGLVDLDDVIINTNILKGATLDNAYDSFAAGAAAGSGRVVNVDAGAVELINDPSGDRWRAGLRVDAFQGGTGVDVRLDRGVQFDAAYASRSPLNTGTSSPHACTLTYVGGQIQISLPFSITDIEDLSATNSEFMGPISVEFPSFSGGDAQNKTYELNINKASNYFYLSYLGTVDIPSSYPSDFNIVSPISTTCEVWKRTVVLGEERVDGSFSSIDNLEVVGKISGPNNQPALGLITLRQHATLREFIESTEAQIVSHHNALIGGSHNDWESAGFGAGMVGSVGIRGASTNTAIDAPWGESNMCSDGRFVYVVKASDGFNAKVMVINPSTGSLVSTRNSFATAQNEGVAIAANGKILFIAYNSLLNLRVDAVDVDTGAILWDGTFTKSGPIVGAIVRNRILYVYRTADLSTNTGGGWVSLNADTGASLSSGGANYLAFRNVSHCSHSIAVLHKLSGNDTLELSGGITTTLPAKDWYFGCYASEDAVYVVFEDSNDIGVTKVSWDGTIVRTEIVGTGNMAVICGSYGHVIVATRDSNSGNSGKVVMFMESDMQCLFQLRSEANNFNFYPNQMACDGHRVHIYNTHTSRLRSLSLGIGPGLWTRTQNSTAVSSPTMRAYPILAKPAWVP